MKIKIFFSILTLLFAGCATIKNQQQQIDSVEVNGELWKPVLNFANSSASDKHYSVKRDEDGSTIIQFGNGKNGAALPAGTRQVRVTYRRGSGRQYTGVRQQQGRIQGDDCR